MPRCTSCSVPLVYKKASLRAKDPRTGKEVPWDPNPEATWIDGSVDNDLPMTRLAEMFNVNHFIVSQVNPHVIPFLEKNAEVIGSESQQAPVASSGSTWKSTTANLARGELLHRFQGLVEVGILPNVMTKAKSILSQRYSGDITIFPRISYADFPRVLSNPTPEYVRGCMLEGQRATWPRMSRIQNHVAIELSLDDTIQKLRARVVFTPSQVNLRLTNLGRPLSQNIELSAKHRAKSVHKITRFETKTEPSSPVLRKSNSTSPLLLRTPGKPNSQIVPLIVARQQHKANASKPRSSGAQHIDSAALDTISSSNDTSDQDYFADPDSDTTDILSSPSPPTTPTFNGPTLWPSLRQPSHTAASQPATPYSHSREWHSGTLLNLTMTSTNSNEPSSPELRYKRLFHPSGPMATDPPPQSPVAESRPNSRPTSRRGSIQAPGTGVLIDHSGTRGMLLRKKSFMKMTPDGMLE